MKSILNYIDGKFVRGKREFADLNPADGTLIAQVSEAVERLGHLGGAHRMAPA